MKKPQLKIRPGLLFLLLATAALYLWNLSSSGYANSFYSAAVQAGSESWKAFFFGSSDAANSITVDKPPAALWPMALSVRLFGLGSWQILVPEALMGVGTVAVLYAAVRRRFSYGAGLLAGAVLALTPVAALMFRFNNPDALLTLLMTVTVYCVLRALEDARTKWLVWAGVAVGLAFLTKTLQAFLILPPLALVYGVCAPTTVRRRIGQLALSAGALIVSAGWWVALVELWPAASRPYIGGSQTNSFLELTFGYNGLGRINGEETGSVGGAPRGGGGGGMWGESGVLRMFNEAVGGQISWLLPAALILLVAGLAVTWRAARTDTARAAFLVWGGALLATAAVFSFMAGIFHEYYTVALAPYVAALVGMGATVLWEERHHPAAALTLAASIGVTGYWAYVLLGRTPDQLPWLRWAVLGAGAVAAVGVPAVGLLSGRGVRPVLLRYVAVGAAALGLATGLAGPAAYAAQTVGTAHTGSIVTAGPSTRGPGGLHFRGGEGEGLWLVGPGGAARVGGPQGAQPPPQGAQPPQGSATPNSPRGGPPSRAGESGGGPMNGLLDGRRVSDAAKALLAADADDYTWAAASVGSQNAASYQLATGKPVMAIGGFNGSDPSPTLAAFQKYVREGRIHYFIGGEGDQGGEGRGMRGPGGEGNGSAISSWVQANFTKVSAGGSSFYDLTKPLAG
ncbi:glycosyl transferase [Streptomyces spiroverticillatus]|uniref:Glycosyl transferase n=1 Tax=Streptomyces finlayi TaxID=67296 RepID=A0A918WUN2_9ACTN|nr:glycosyltransferase family 39 protein [Streptomyces finlayi]GGZ99967.1 glycosyl transferase [Streptomyces spiroverticillatus]GHC84552.1 glycosyl transferase [Streptomyces finlayi]